MIVPIILAAGESSRMGMLKPLVEINGETFLQRLIKILRSSKAGKITVVLGNRAEEIVEYVDLSDCTIVINPEYKNGQLSSLRKAILSIPEEGVEGILVCLVDHPYINSNLVDQLIDAFYASKKEIVVPVYGKKRGHPVIFSNKMFSHILAASLEVGAREVLWNNPDEVLELNVNEPGVLKDIDYPEDIE